MLKIKVPASSANLGSGFDCLGLALDLYNTFEIELSDEDKIENDDPRFNNPDNLFLKSFHRGCEAIGTNDHVHVVVHADIPVSRGLGSSAAMTVGGLAAASVLHDDALSDDQIFTLASELEGHPDNAAPCVYGGLTASGIYENRFITHSLELHKKWHFTIFVPDFEVSTPHARAVMPASYPRSDASTAISHAIWETEALRTGSLPLLKAGTIDCIHEPYRKKLIKTYDQLKEIAEADGTGVLLISGSGSTCLLISELSLRDTAKEKIHQIKEVNWTIKELHPSNGVEVWGDTQ